MRTIVWFRGKDLRISDHEALLRACEFGEVIPLFVLDPYFFAPERAQKIPHRMQFLVESLVELAATIASRGSELVLRAGRSVDLVPALAERWQADRVVAHRWVEPFARRRDAMVRQAIGDRFELFEGETLVPPGTLRSSARKPYAVFSAFARAFRRVAVIGNASAAPRSLPALPRDIRPNVAVPSLRALGIDRNPNLLRGGEAWARRRLQRFIERAAESYDEHRDRMDLAGTSRLSADLKFGTISPRQVWTEVEKHIGATRAGNTFLNELIWREFAHSTLWDRPEVLDVPFRAKFIGFPWRCDDDPWHAWASGNTGYPIVDAAARQLLGEGFVHNRARMISASFLTKHLLINYQAGEAHYMKYLTDGDWAQNNAGWQWSAGCGSDAQPYFRIFNP